MGNCYTQCLHWTTNGFVMVYVCVISHYRRCFGVCVFYLPHSIVDCSTVRIVDVLPFVWFAAQYRRCIGVFVVSSTVLSLC